MNGKVSEKESLEQMLKFFRKHPITMRRERAILLADGRQEQLYERTQETRLTSAGMPATDEVHRFMQLDDGSTSADAALCQTCGRKVRVQSLRRCPCGRTCCVVCRKLWADPRERDKQRDYCRVSHVFLHRMGLLQRF